MSHGCFCSCSELPSILVLLRSIGASDKEWKHNSRDLSLTEKWVSAQSEGKSKQMNRTNVTEIVLTAWRMIGSANSKPLHGGLLSGLFLLGLYLKGQGKSLTLNACDFTTFCNCSSLIALPGPARACLPELVYAHAYNTAAHKRGWAFGHAQHTEVHAAAWTH